MLENLTTLYGVQFCNYLLPLITIPYLSRVLGPKGWGSVALAQSAGAYIALAVEYGFEFSATRKIVQCGNDRKQMGEIAAGVFGCKALFSAVVIVLACVLYPVSGFFGANIGLLWWSALLWGLSGGWNILWLFQGLQRVRQAGLLDISAKLLGTAGIFLLVHSPADGWKILAMQGILSFLAIVAGARMVYRVIPFVWPRRRDVVLVIREGWAMFLFKSSAIAMLSSNTFILGFFAPLERVGWYAAGEKISRSCWQLLSPITQVLYPELARLTHFEAKRGRKMATLCTAVTSLVGLVLGIALYISAPLVVNLLMGKAFAPSVAVLRWLAWLGPMVALNSAIAFFWLFPAGLERPYTRIVLWAMAGDIVLNGIFAPRLAEIGTAMAVILAEIVVLSGALFLLRARLHSGNSDTGGLESLAAGAQGGN